MSWRGLLVSFIIFLGLNAEADTVCWNIKRGFASFSENWPSGPDGLRGTVENGDPQPLELFRTLVGDNGDFEFRFRVRNHHCNPSKRYKYRDEKGGWNSTRLPSWSLILKNDRDEQFSFHFKSSETETDGISSQPCLELAAKQPDGSTSIFQFKSKGLAENLLDGSIGPDPTGSRNYFRLRVKDGEIKLYGGLHAPELLYSGEMPSTFEATALGFRLEPGSKLEFNDMRLSTKNRQRLPFSSPWDDERLLEDYLNQSRDNAEGYWQILDRSLEETMLRIGGDYRFALVRAGDGYDLIYLSGARVNGERWKPGMVKCHLSSSGIEGVWNVEWIDSMFGSIANDIKAQFENGSTLLIQFPYHDSHVRLQKTR